MPRGAKLPPLPPLLRLLSRRPSKSTWKGTCLTRREWLYSSEHWSLHCSRDSQQYAAPNSAESCGEKGVNRAPSKRPACASSMESYKKKPNPFGTVHKLTTLVYRIGSFSWLIQRKFGRKKGFKKKSDHMNTTSARF